MKYDSHLVTESWDDYELLDSGEGMKLERFGEVTLARPETQALWAKQKPELWRGAMATFVSGTGGEKGVWKKGAATPEKWEMARGPLRFTAKLTNFKHVGVFPEQEPNWVWIKDRVKAFSQQSAGASPQVLNLFGYTGIATLAAAHAGAKVTHVDASKQSLDWAHENARLTGLPEDAIRWIPDDALVFAKREARRGAKYDGIILDPPAFGRGPKGEVWKIEKDLSALLASCKELLSEEPGAFFLLNGYAAGYAPRSLAQAVESAFPSTALGTSAASGEFHIKESDSDRVIPTGIYCRFVRE